MNRLRTFFLQALVKEFLVVRRSKGQTKNKIYITNIEIDKNK